MGEGREKERYRLPFSLSSASSSPSSRLLQGASQSSEASNHALEVVRTQLLQTEEQLSQEREAALRAKVT